MSQSLKSSALSSGRSSRLVPMLLLFIALAVVIRLLLLFAITRITHGKEFADDSAYYEIFLKHPTALITGDGAAENPDQFKQMSIYSPLIPIQYAYPGRWLVSAFGSFTGNRLTMMFYDLLAISIAGYVMLSQENLPFRRSAVVGLLLLTCIPGSLGAATVFAQEDTIAAFWAAIAALLLRKGHPTIAAMVGTMGLFTHKLFGGLVSVGMWIAGKGARYRIMFGTIVVALAFALFVYLRSLHSGMLITSYSYDAVYNSPSPWALLNRVMDINFAGIKIMVFGATAVVMLGATWVLLHRKVYFAEAIVAIHAAFFAIFLGIMPEHHQWFMPFLMIVLYRAAQHQDWLTFGVGWLYSGIAYSFKLLYGLQARPSFSTGGKDAFRHFLTNGLGPYLPALQVTFNVLAIVWAILLFWRAVQITKTRNWDGTNEPAEISVV